MFHYFSFKKRFAHFRYDHFTRLFMKAYKKDVTLRLLSPPQLQLSGP